MGVELAVAAALAAGGAGANAYNTRRTAKRQDSAAAEGIRAQGSLQRQADSRINDQIGALERSGPEQAQAESVNQFLQQLRATRGGAQGAASPVLGGQRYQEGQANANASIQNFGSRAADVLSRIRAPQDQRQGEAINAARAASDVGGIARRASGEDYLNQLRVSNIQRDPWIDAASQVLSGASSAAAGRAGRAPKPKHSAFNSASAFPTPYRIGG